MIDPSKVTAVLIGSEWIEVKTFAIRALEFGEAAQQVATYRGGAAFSVTTADGVEISGPMSALQAVKLGSGQTTVRKGRPPKQS